MASFNIDIAGQSNSTREQATLTLLHSLTCIVQANILKKQVQETSKGTTTSTITASMASTEPSGKRMELESSSPSLEGTSGSNDAVQNSTKSELAQVEAAEERNFPGLGFLNDIVKVKSDVRVGIDAHANSDKEPAVGKNATRLLGMSLEVGVAGEEPELAREQSAASQMQPVTSECEGEESSVWTSLQTMHDASTKKRRRLALENSSSSPASLTADASPFGPSEARENLVTTPMVDATDLALTPTLPHIASETVGGEDDCGQPQSEGDQPPLLDVDSPLDKKDTSSPLNPIQGRKRRSRAETLHDSALLPDDGHHWHKYGQKNLMDKLYCRAYFRCARTSQGCRAKKTIDIPVNGSGSPRVVYHGVHNHGVLNAFRMHSNMSEPSQSKVLSLALEEMRRLAAAGVLSSSNVSCNEGYPDIQHTTSLNARESSFSTGESRRCSRLNQDDIGQLSQSLVDSVLRGASAPVPNQSEPSACPSSQVLSSLFRASSYLTSLNHGLNSPQGASPLYSPRTEHGLGSPQGSSSHFSPGMEPGVGAQSSGLSDMRASPRPRGAGFSSETIVNHLHKKALEQQTKLLLNQAVGSSAVNLEAVRRLLTIKSLTEKDTGEDRPSSPFSGIDEERGGSGSLLTPDPPGSLPRTPTWPSSPSSPHVWNVPSPGALTPKGFGISRPSSLAPSEFQTHVARQEHHEHHRDDPIGGASGLLRTNTDQGKGSMDVISLLQTLVKAHAEAQNAQDSPRNSFSHNTDMKTRRHAFTPSTSSLSLNTRFGPTQAASFSLGERKSASEAELTRTSSAPRHSSDIAERASDMDSLPSMGNLTSLNEFSFVQLRHQDHDTDLNLPPEDVATSCSPTHRARDPSSLNLDLKL